MKEIYIVPHSHWDREWYMPFENHRVRLVWLMDDLLETIEANDAYAHFHLDGQSIILDDYLEIKPYMKDKIIKYVKDGRLSVGPWYVLQDEYLISDEANVRNLLIGMKESERYGGVSKIGYFPDAFGNVSQAPQILNGFGIDNAVFGRGINAVGFNNKIISDEVVEEFSSELHWASPDGSKVLGIFMANWYSNGKEIPSETDQAIEFLVDAIEKADHVASTECLLLMNGSDHQPAQLDLPDIIERVQPLLEDVHLKQSSLIDYIDAVKENVHDLKIFHGEMNSQHTEGWWTLTNTASARVYLKQMNNDCQVLLENHTEPIETMAYLYGKKYACELIEHSWKLLLQNHPHDSICGCSVDEVHDEMVTRFRKSEQLANTLKEDSLDYLLGEKDPSYIDMGCLSFAVFNPLNWCRTGIVEVTIDLPEGSELHEPIIIDGLGQSYDMTYDYIGRVFSYRLPKDQFRVVTYVNRYLLQVKVNHLEQFEMKQLFIKNSSKNLAKNLSTLAEGRMMENEYYQISINENGSFDVTDKETGKKYPKLNVYEDGSDIGDEYIYKAPEEDRIVTTADCNAKVSLVQSDALAVVCKIVQNIAMPIATELRTYVTLESGVKRIDIKCEMTNVTSNHRLRSLFPTDLVVDHHHAHGQYDVIKRPNMPWEGWKNPSNCLKQRYFVDLSDDQVGLTIANKGLMEYEIVNKNTIALTLFRAVGEMGDWGEFPTEGSQCLGEQVFEYSIIPHEEGWCSSKSYRSAYELNVPLLGRQIYDVAYDDKRMPFVIGDKNVVVTAIKKAEERESVIVRLYNISEEMVDLNLALSNEVAEVYVVNLNESRQKKIQISDKAVRVKVGAKKIGTYEFGMI